MKPIREFQLDDLPVLFAISIKTGLSGGDASHLYLDPNMIGHIYSAPYAVLEPRFALVVEDRQGVAGFAVGTIDTEAWEDRLEREWWPRLRKLYPDPAGKPREAWSADERRAFMIHHPARTPEWVDRHYPAHVHINLLPRAQGAGVGRRLLNSWLSLAAVHGKKRIHVGVNAANGRAIRFWQRSGFERLDHALPDNGRKIWMGYALDQ
ncbi:N-acetyltransferase [Roseibium sp. RKSG952]|uniref:GNAT family N-acetyltransferase n=1 Tax=Roseibium sp. RKSG952 TaxID=2529384 RepID=UPI0012BC41A6|nr:GNAT family N-acetyltransferase [Roseibium sp. RKSG952]MTH95705.1 GNAT family N-acetyltransferase [Roseibium sp. RKSG952]